MDDSMNKIMAQLQFNITPALSQLRELALAAERSALAAREAFAKTTLTMGAGGLNTGQMTAQQAMVNQITAEGEARRIATVAKGEAEISAIQAREALTRQATLTKQSQNELAIVRKQVEQEKLLYMEARKAAFENQPTGILGLASRHASWMLTGGLIFGGIELIKQGVSDVSASMTKLKQVLEIVPPYDKSPKKLADDLNELKDVAGVMATAYGVDFSKVMDVMSQAGRRFKDVASIISATDTALQLVLVDAVPVETAIKSVEAIMSQFGLTTGQSKQALFEISAAAHMLQINATDLLTAIQRSGSAFATMKMNTKESIAAISTLAQMTAISGGTIGNTWKSLEASLASPNGKKALGELKIELFDTNGQIDDMSGTLVELQEKWKTLSDEAKMHYAMALAGGKFQYQKLEAFLDDYTGAYKKALAGIETANADMQKKLVEAAMTSLPQQLKMTSASLQVLTAELTSEVTPALIMFLTSVRGGIQDLKDHTGELKGILDTGVKLAEGYIAWKISVYAFGVATKIATSEVVLFNSAAGELYALSLGMPPVLAGVAGGIVGIGAAAIGALAKLLPLVAGLMAFDRLRKQATDPLGTQIGDLQAEQDRLQSLIKDQWTPGQSLKKAGADFWEHPVQAFNHTLDAGLGWLPTADSAKEKAQTQWSANEGTLNSLIDQKKAATEDALNRDLNNLNEIMAKYEKEANEKTAAALAGAGLNPDGTPIVPVGNAGTPGGSPTPTDWLTPYMEDILFAAEAQDKLNEATQRGIDIQESLMDLHTSSAMSAQEYATGLNSIASMTELYRKQQEGLHAEADAYRAAITILEEKQRSINTSTDEGREAYNKLGAEIETANGKISEMQNGYIAYERKIREGPSNQYKEMAQWVEKLADMNAITLDQQIEIYEAVDKTKLLEVTRVELMEKQIELGKKLLQQEVDKQIAVIEQEKASYKAASDARIADLQEQLDIMDEQTDALAEQKQITEATAKINEASSDLAKAKTKLSNVQKEKNTRIFENGSWSYQANPQDVKDAQQEVEDANDALIDAQNDFNDTMEEIRKSANRKAIEEQIEHEKELQKANEDFLNEREKIIKDAGEKLIADQVQWGTEMDSGLQTILDTLNITAGSKLAIMAQTVAAYSAQMKKSLLSIAEATGVDITGLTTPKAAETGKELLGANATGGAINKTGLYLDHEGEYMLNRPTVNALGGVRGVENMIASLRFPKAITASNIVRSSSSTSSVSNDYGVKVDKVVVHQVYNVDGLVRNLKQLARS